MFTEKRPAFQAKNRYGLPAQINDVSYKAFDDARKLCRIDPLEGLKNEAVILANGITDMELKTKVAASINGAKSEQELNVIIGKIKKVIGEPANA